MHWKRLSQSALAGVLGLALLVGLNVLLAKYDLRWDSTASKRYSLSPETADILAKSGAAVTAAVFYRPSERTHIEELLKLFSQKAPGFTYEFVDPDRSPFRAREYDVTQSGTVVLLSGEKQEKVLFPDEEKLINAYIRVSAARRAKLYFVEGHGETDFRTGDESSCSQFAKTLAEQGADLLPLTLARETTVPEDADALLILGPTKDFFDHELKVLDNYWAKGGHLFIALSAEQPTNLDGWLQTLGLQRLHGFVVDPVSRLLVGDPMAPLVQDYGLHAVTRDFSLMTVFPTAVALEALEVPEGAAVRPRVEYLGRSTPQSWLETDLEALRSAGTAEFNEQEDRSGPLWLAAVVEGEAAEGAASGQRAVVFADQDFLTDRYVNLSGNRDLARNSANWLLEREGLISVSKPEAANVFLLLSVPERLLVTWVPLLLVPGFCLLAAVLVALGRRKVK